MIRDLIKNRRDILELGKVLKQNVYTQVSMLTKEQMLAFIEYFKNVWTIINYDLGWTFRFLKVSFIVGN